jgi:hypothetical protein
LQDGLSIRILAARCKGERDPPESRHAGGTLAAHQLTTLTHSRGRGLRHRRARPSLAPPRGEEEKRRSLRSVSPECPPELWRHDAVKSGAGHVHGRYRTRPPALVSGMRSGAFVGVRVGVLGRGTPPPVGTHSLSRRNNSHRPLAAPKLALSLTQSTNIIVGGSQQLARARCRGAKNPSSSPAASPPDGPSSCCGELWP